MKTFWTIVEWGLVAIVAALSLTVGIMGCHHMAQKFWSW